VNKWYSSERDMLKEGHGRLKAMFCGADLELSVAATATASDGVDGRWRGKITQLSGCDGEIIFFDRTVSGVRKPTTVVDVRLTLQWTVEAAGVQVANGTATCAELSAEALAEGLNIDVRAAGAAPVLAASVVDELQRSIRAVVDGVGRRFFADLHEALGIPQLTIDMASNCPPTAQHLSGVAYGVASHGHSVAADVGPDDTKVTLKPAAAPDDETKVTLKPVAPVTRPTNSKNVRLPKDASARGGSRRRWIVPCICISVVVAAVLLWRVSSRGSVPPQMPRISQSTCTPQQRAPRQSPQQLPRRGPTATDISAGGGPDLSSEAAALRSARLARYSQ
jgi:hypothetical protein